MSTQLPFSPHPHRQPFRPLPDAVKKANRRSDYVIYAVVILVLFIPGVLAAVFIQNLPLISVIVGALVTILAGFIVVRLQQNILLANTLRVQSGSLETLREDVITLAKALNMQPVDVLITQDPYLNAYAFGFARPYTIVLHSATVENLTYNEMLAILVHEMGHVKYLHTFLQQFLQPIQALPLIGTASDWVINFWSRRNEYTADRLAVAFTGDPDLVIRALIKVHVGSFVGEYLTKEQVLYQESISRGGMRRVAQTLSTHPFLVNRIKAIVRFADAEGYAMADDLRQFVRRAPKS